jgi:hypothetical protein
LNFKQTTNNFENDIRRPFLVLPLRQSQFVDSKHRNLEFSFHYHVGPAQWVPEGEEFFVSPIFVEK